MEQGFDFSQLKWIIIFAVVILVNLLNKKPKVDPQPLDQDDSMDGDQESVITVKDLFEELFQEPSKRERVDVDPLDRVEPVPVVSETPQAAMPLTPIVASSTKGNRKRVDRPRVDPHQSESKISDSEIGSHESEAARIAENFDMREAVIFSEILNRKFDE